MNDSSELQLGTSDFTMSAWIKTDGDRSNTQAQIIYKRGFESGGGVTFDNPGDGYLRGGIRFDSGNNTNEITSTHTPFDGSWHHVVFVRDGTDIYLYDNLDEYYEANAFPNSNDASASGYEMRIGDTIYGIVDEVTIWDRALSLSEIGDLYNGGDGLSLVE